VNSTLNSGRLAVTHKTNITYSRHTVLQFQTKTSQNKQNQNQIKTEQKVQQLLRMPIVLHLRNCTEVIHQQQQKWT